jgi:hypothetical protein
MTKKKLPALSPNLELSILKELVKGRDSLTVRQQYKLNREQIQFILFHCVPGFESHLLDGDLTPEHKDELLEFLQVVETLLIYNRDVANGKNLLIVLAQDELRKLLSFSSFSNSSFIHLFGMQCLNEWRKYKDQILNRQITVKASVFRLSESELASLLDILEQFAIYFPIGQLASILPDVAKYHGHLLLNLEDIEGASRVFERAAKYVRDRGQSVQYKYLNYFSNQTAYRTAWKKLIINEARSYFTNTIKLAEEMLPSTFTTGFYWDLMDLKRDEILLNATEKANDGLILESVGFLSEWLRNSKELEYSSPFYPRVFVRKLALDFLASDNKQQQNELRIKLRQYLIIQDIKYRSDLFCFHIIQLVWHNVLKPDEASRAIAKLIPRDADIEEAQLEDVKALADEFEVERQDLRYIPSWIVKWLQSDGIPQRQAFALQAYSCFIAEYYSAHFNIPKPCIFDGLDWAIERIKNLLEYNIRNRTHFENFLNRIECISETDPLETVKQSAGILFPHIVRPQVVISGNVELPETVRLERFWAKRPRILQFSTSSEETWYPGCYYYLDPRLNFHQLDRLQRDPHESFDPVLARLYGEPNPNPVVLVVEGPTEEGFFKRLLDVLYPSWQALNIQIHVGKGTGGTYLQVIETVAKLYSNADFILVYDNDAKVEMDKGLEHQWEFVESIRNRSPHFVMVPDIEGINPAALLSAVKQCWPAVTFVETDILPKLENYIEDVMRNPKSKKPEGTITAARDLIRQTTNSQWRGVRFGKSVKWGECLADAMLQNVELPKIIRSVLEQVLIAARGLVIPTIQ